jgi:hypothetical protein
VEFFTAIVAILDGQTPNLPADHPYAAAVAAIQAGIAGGAAPALPFDADLVPRSIAALLGTPQEKLAHAQRLAALAAQSDDAELKRLVTAIQTALFGAAPAAWAATWPGRTARRGRRSCVGSRGRADKGADRTDYEDGR